TPRSTCFVLFSPISRINGLTPARVPAHASWDASTDCKGMMSFRIWVAGMGLAVDKRELERVRITSRKAIVGRYCTACLSDNHNLGIMTNPISISHKTREVYPEP